MSPAPWFCRVGSAELSRSLLVLSAAFLSLGGLARADEADAPVHSVGPVTVTATRAEREVLDVPGNVTVIDREAIDKSGARDLPNLLRRQSGLFVTQRSPADTRVEARGFNNGGSLGSSTLVMVDGRRVNEADSGDTDWALLDMDRVERVEIIRGPASAIYGDNAIGGVINIITRPEAGSEGPWKATLRGGGGSFNTGEGSLRLDGTHGPVSGTLFAQGLTTDGYRDLSEYWNVNLDGSLEWALGERVVLGLGGGWHEDERDLPGALSRDEIARLGRRTGGCPCPPPDYAPTTLDNRFDVERWFLRSWLDADLAEDVRLHVQPFGRQRQDDAVFTLMGFGTSRTATEKASAGFDARVQVDRSIGEFPNRLIVGLDFLHDDTDRDISGDFLDAIDDNRRWVLGSYLQNEFSILENLFLAAGVRYDYAEYRLQRQEFGANKELRSDYDLWSPKASLTYRVIEPLSLYFSYARGFRLPNFDEDLPFFADPLQLAPQESNSYELGAKVQDARVGAAIALYRMDVENEVILDPVVFNNLNFDEVQHQGVELSLDAVVIEGWLELWGSYTYDDVEIQKYNVNPDFEGRRMPMIPEHRGTVGIRTLLPFGFEVAANGNIVGSRHLADDFLNVERQLDTYGTADFFFTWRPDVTEHWEGFLTFAIRNATDEEFDEFGSLFGPSFYPAPTRSYDVRFMLTYRR